MILLKTKITQSLHRHILTYVYTTHIHRHLDVHKQNNKKKVVKISRANDRLLGKNTKKKLKYLR